MTAPTLGKRVHAQYSVLALGKRVRPTLPADVAARLRSDRVQSFVDGAGQRWEWSAFKTRYVRTAAGAKRYGLPIGSPIVAKGKKPKGGGEWGGKSGKGGAAPKPSGDPSGGNGGEGGPSKPAPKPVSEPTPKTAPKPGGKVKLTPAQRDAAERHLGREPNAGRGAYLDGNQLVVEDRDAAVKALDQVLADPDLTPGERKARKNLRDKIAAHPGADKPAKKAGESPAGDEHPDPTPEPRVEPAPKLSHEDLDADWKNNGPKLSKDEADAVREYADAGFYEINGLLRGNLTDLEERDTDEDYRKKVEAEYRDKINALRNIQDRYRTPGPTTVYRRVPHGVLSDGKMQPGEVFRDKAFLSTSTTQNPGTFANHPVLMEIDVPKGTPAININATGHGISGEREILLPPGLKLQVVSDETKDGKRWVKMTAVPL